MKIKAIALFSGGLDSILAAKMIVERGFKVEALHFENPFAVSEKEQKQNLLNKVAGQLGIKLKYIALGKQYLRIIQNPKYGYGKNLNPCIDCRIWLLKQAKEYMDKVGASFLVTGEVLGQRPMSQHRQALFTIDKESGLAGLILRPLSGKLLRKTIPEEKGWVKRENLLAISGRSRKQQLCLADKYGIKDYFWAGGGCLLTDEGFTRRLKEIIDSNELTLKNIQLLKIGRHFNFQGQFKFVVARNEKEGTEIEKLARKTDFLFKPIDKPGPTGLIRGSLTEANKKIGAEIVARYSSSQKGLKVAITKKSEETKHVVKAIKPKNNKYKVFML